MNPVVGMTVEEARSYCSARGLTLRLVRTAPPRNFFGDDLRVVQAHEGPEGMEIVVAAFARAGEPGQ